MTTDVLLDESTIPNRKNHEIAELGLPVQATKNLYTGKASADVINRLLECSCFCELTYLIERKLDDPESRVRTARLWEPPIFPSSVSTQTVMRIV